VLLCFLFLCAFCPLFFRVVVLKVNVYAHAYVCNCDGKQKKSRQKWNILLFSFSSSSYSLCICILLNNSFLDGQFKYTTWSKWRREWQSRIDILYLLFRKQQGISFDDRSLNDGDELPRENTPLIDSQEQPYRPIRTPGFIILHIILTVDFLSTIWVLFVSICFHSGSFSRSNYHFSSFTISAWSS